MMDASVQRGRPEAISHENIYKELEQHDEIVIDTEHDLETGASRKVITAPDGGWGWVVCAACFMSHFLTDGLFYSFGVVFVELLDYFKSSKGETAMIASLSTGVCFFGGPVFAILVNKLDCRITAAAGALIASGSLIISVFAQDILFLYFSLGILFGIGLGMVYLPSIVSVSQYFEKRRALATGIGVSGAGIGTFVMSPLTSLLISTYTWQGAILIQGGLILNCLVCASVYRPINVGEIDRGARTEVEMMDCKRDHTIIKRDYKNTQNDNTNSQTDHINTQESFSDIQAAQDDHINTQESFSDIQTAQDDHINTQESFSDIQTAQDDHINTQESFSDIQTAQGDHINTQHDHTHSQDDITYAEDNIDKLDSEKSESKERSHDIQGINESVKLSVVETVDSETSCQQASKHPLLIKATCIEKQPIPARNTFKHVIHTCHEKIKTSFDVSIFQNVTYNLFLVSTFLYSLGYYVPYIYIPDTARKAGIDDFRGSLLISSIGITNTVGRVLFGFLSDRKGVNKLLLYATALTLCGVATCAGPLLTSFEMLLVYTMVFGASSGVTISLTSVLLSDILGIKRLPDGLGVSNFFAGIASFSGPPLAGWLYDISGSYLASYIAAGATIFISGVMLFPIPYIERRLNQHSAFVNR